MLHPYSNHNLQEIGQDEKQIDGKGSNQACWCNPLGSTLPAVHSTRDFRDKDKPRMKSSTDFSYEESKENEEKKAKNWLYGQKCLTLVLKLRNHRRKCKLSDD